MNIRIAGPADRPAIIELLRQSLGESTVPKSEALWSWKHEQNPFGQSYVLLAEENGTLIGLRAFMQWDWQWQGKRYKAIRAVDTATHPAHQGKGIFKKLTLQQAEACKQEGVQFVFNTPNTQSKPGYLKMGWVEQGKMPLKFKIVQPLALGYSMMFNKKKVSSYKDDPTPHMQWPEYLFQKVDQAVAGDDQLSTAVSGAYVKWRYAENPLANYNYVTDNENFLVILRMKDHFFGKELRISDFILLKKEASSKKVSAQIKKAIIQYSRKNNVRFISLSGQQYQQYKAYFSWMGFVPVRSLGPIVTLKDLNMNSNFPQLLDVNNWAYSLGDMELF
ncbi:GNAT family N-acetyltransferase [Flavisolibacter tropicus]|uniref:GNAT family N-acetyltransferase n=1 Tax=Flavisolibacter tropicus TaxID=1492898 RepID=UPI000831BD22|nr:GNAT family N-acetyltransferase [Flavisolibacter tropicus]